MMKNCKNIWLLPLFMIISIFSLQAQNGEKMKERLKAYKKIMLMEKLEMNEEQSIKFFARYNEQEAFIKKAKGELDQAVEMLELNVDAGKGDSEKLMQTVFEKDHALKKSIIDRIKSMKNMLTDKQYAKYVLIEYRLIDDVKKAIKKRKNK